jgi:AcrR family transcriptional regulator
MVINQQKGESPDQVLDSEADANERPKRADARRNQARLIAAARAVFAESGAGASMEAVARQAGVGVGTLYRNFPHRIDLVEAVYSTDVQELSEAAKTAVATLEPWPAVTAFFEAFVRYALTKQTLLSELHQAFEKNPELKSHSRELINGAFDLVIDRARTAGVIRNDVDGSDVVQLVSPVCTNPAVPADQLERLVSMILDGLRYPAESTAVD